MSTFDRKVTIKGSFSLVILSLIYVYGSMPLKVGSTFELGPGAFPIIVGSLLLLCSLAYLYHCLKKNTVMVNTQTETNVKTTRSNFNKLEKYTVAICTIIYPFILPVLKFFIATQIVAFAMFLAYRRKTPFQVFGWALAVNVICFVIFYCFLLVPLPTGVLEEKFVRLINI